MAFVATPNAARAAVFTDLDGQHCENTLAFFHTAGAIVIADLEALAGILVTWYSDNILPHLSSDAVFRGVLVTDQTSETAPAFALPTLPTPGGVDEIAEANNVAFVIKFLTGGRGRSSRGRNYVVGIPKASVTNSEIADTRANQYLDGYNNLITALDGSGWQWVVLSTRHNGVDRAEGLAQEVTSATYTDLVVDSQRRRLPGRGN